MAAMAVHHQFLSTYNKEREGKDLPSSVQARDEVVFFKFAKKMMIWWRKGEKREGKDGERIWGFV